MFSRRDSSYHLKRITQHHVFRYLLKQTIIAVVPPLRRWFSRVLRKYRPPAISGKRFRDLLKSVGSSQDGRYTRSRSSPSHNYSIHIISVCHCTVFLLFSVNSSIFSASMKNYYIFILVYSSLIIFGDFRGILCCMKQILFEIKYTNTPAKATQIVATLQLRRNDGNKKAT